jgi:hypothetical protein
MGKKRGLGGARGATVRCGLPGRVCGSATHTCSIYHQHLPGQWRREGGHIRGRHVRNEGSSDLLGLLEAALLGQTRVIVAVQLVHRQHRRTAVSGRRRQHHFAQRSKMTSSGRASGGSTRDVLGEGTSAPLATSVDSVASAYRQHIPERNHAAQHEMSQCPNLAKLARLGGQGGLEICHAPSLHR